MLETRSKADYCIKYRDRVVGMDLAGDVDTSTNGDTWKKHLLSGYEQEH